MRVSTLNSSTGIIASGASFTGQADSTLNAAGIQIQLYMDQNATVSVQQSIDTVPTGPHWDLVDNYRYFANQNFGITVQCISSYFRVVVTNTGSSATTFFRLSSVLCPVVEAVPRSLTDFGSLKTAIAENIATVSSGNCKTDLTGSQAWEGSWQEVYNQSAIQLIAKFTQDYIVYVDQGQDGANADLTDTWTALANQGFSVAVGSVAPYFRVRITNRSASAATGTITTAATAIFNPLPRTLDSHGHFNTAVQHIHGSFNHDVIVSPMGALKTAGATRLIGSSFTGTTVDTNFWTGAATAGGTATQAAGVLTLNTNTTANGGYLVNSNRVARYIGSNPNYYRASIRLPAVTTASASYSNTRRWGAFDASDGYFFKAVQTNPAATPTLSVVCRKASAIPIDTNTIDSGSFNGDYGPSYTLDANVHTYEIFWTNKNAYFIIDDVILHTFSGLTVPLVDTPSLKVGLECQNSGGNTANNTMAVRSSTVNRLGQMLTQPTSRYTTGVQASAVVCKYGPGNIHGVLVGTVAASGSVITIYDGVTTGGTVMAVITINYPGGGNFIPASYDFKGIPFFTGLCYTVTAQSANVTFMYE